MHGFIVQQAEPSGHEFVRLLCVMAKHYRVQTWLVMQEFGTLPSIPQFN